MFNVRVYGILINNQQQVLLSDELINGTLYTKFCGGGLESGEGTIDCVKREFMEEINLPVEVTAHFYTTDFYQQSIFNQEHQLISIYYFVKPLQEINFQISPVPISLKSDPVKLTHPVKMTESFRWIEWDDFSADSLSFPIDKVVAGLLKNKK